MSKDIQQQKQYRILLIGDSCEDIYVHGEVKRISPEAPVPVLKKTKKYKMKGMAENVFQNLENIKNKNILIDCYFNDSKMIKKIRFIDNKTNYQIMRYDIEKNVNNLTFEEINKNNKYDVIIISDYDKGYINNELVGKLTKYFKSSKIFVDTKKLDLSYFKNCLIKLNEDEAQKAKNIHHTSEIIVTLGEKGCMYKDKAYATKKVEVHDATGAGDVFLASMVIRWIETGNIISAIKTANNCSSLSVTKKGCYALKREEYENLRI